MSKDVATNSCVAKPPDGIGAEVRCVVTKFINRKQKRGSGKNGERTIKSQTGMSCRLVCAYSEGVIGFSMRDIDLMLTLRIDDLFAVLKSAADANMEFSAEVKKLSDADLEKKWEELSDIPFDEADTPSGLILAQDWWIFPKGTDREDIWRHFDNAHSKGVHHLLYERGTREDG